VTFFVEPDEEELKGRPAVGMLWVEPGERNWVVAVAVSLAE
jgi:hypothetical protein